MILLLWGLIYPLIPFLKEGAYNHKFFLSRAGIIGLAWAGPTKDTYPTEKPMYVVSNMDGEADNFLVHNQTILSLLKHNIPYTGWTDFVAFNWLSGRPFISY